jgi:hypothetical protein
MFQVQESMVKIRRLCGKDEIVVDVIQISVLL